MTPVERKYMADLWALKCAPELFASGIFPNAKEYTESAAAYHAVKLIPGIDLQKPTQLIAVADGHTPRTAALFAFRSRWDCHSVDPNMSNKAWNSIVRLHVHRCKMENAVLPEVTDVAILVAVHSHVPLSICLSRMSAKVIHVVAIPCCFPLELPRSPDISYADESIWSPKNEVKIWVDATC